MVDLSGQSSVFSALSFDPAKHRPEEKMLIVIAKVPATLPPDLNVSEGESDKSKKFLKEEDKRAYLYRHHLLRTWLSHWLNIPPVALPFEVNPFGKPFISASEIQFNMSRSQDTLAFIFAPVMAGIDIELLRDPKPFLPIAKRFFHPAEQDMILNEIDFFDIWTRKEAVLKAQGIGLFDGLAAVDCSKNTLRLLGHDYVLHTFKTTTNVISAAFENRDIPLEIYSEGDTCVGPEKLPRFKQ